MPPKPKPTKPAAIEPHLPSNMLVRVLAIAPDGNLVIYGSVIDEPATLL